jgi:chromosome partitioning protein
MATGLSTILDLVDRINDIRRALRDQNFAPNSVKRVEKRYGMKEAQEMVGRSYQAIRDAEADGRLPKPQKGPNNRRLGFTPEEINHMRDVFGTRLSRAPEDEPVVLAIQNFKGGVAKTTLCVHLAQYLARRGYRTLLIDCDSQASTTQTFGYLPDEQLQDEDTLLPFLRSERDVLDYAVRETYWDGLSLLPANLKLYQAEYEMAIDVGPHTFEHLRRGVATLGDRYDIIIMDPPPALGMISLNVMYAANAMLIPMPPVMYDFSSTIAFLTMLAENLKVLERRVGKVEYKFVRAVITRYDEGKSAQAALADLLQEVFGHYVLSARMKESAEIVSAANTQRTVYELDQPATSHRVHARCVNFLDAVNAEIEILIRKCWPSHRQELSYAGVL